jgi:hypothetical protein
VGPCVQNRVPWSDRDWLPERPRAVDCCEWPSVPAQESQEHAAHVALQEVISLGDRQSPSPFRLAAQQAWCGWLVRCASSGSRCSGASSVRTSSGA